MSIQTTKSRHESISQEEDDDDQFIKESTELAKSFTELFINTQEISGSTIKSPLVDHQTKFTTTAYMETYHPGAEAMPVMANPVTNPLTLRLAETLETVSQRIDDKLLNAKFTASQRQVLDKRGCNIWDIIYKDFRDIMHGVFTSLDESVLERSSGWEMTALVYRGVAGLVRDLRQESGSRNHGNRAREETLQSYIGNFLEEVGLMTWINGQGGLGQWGNEQREQYRIPRLSASTETPV